MIVGNAFVKQKGQWTMCVNEVKIMIMSGYTSSYEYKINNVVAITLSIDFPYQDTSDHEP